MAFENVKDSYKPSEWAAREQFYIDALAGIEIPEDISTKNVMQLESKIDKVNTEARLDLVYAERKFETLDRMKKIIERELFLLIKSNNIPGIKTVDEVNGAIAVALRMIPAADIIAGKPLDNSKAAIFAEITNIITQTQSTPSSNTQISLLQAIRTADERLIFLKHITEILEDKHGRLITSLGALKLEAGVGGSLV